MSNLKDFNVNDLDFENMGSWPTPVKIITGVIVFVLVLLLGYQLVVSEDEAQLEREILNERKHKQDFETKQARAVHLEAYKNQMVMIQSSFEALLKQLPQNSEVPSLVDEISYAATGAGLELGDFVLRDQIDKEIYFEAPVEISIIGGYHQLAEFVSRVSNMPRIVTLHDFTIEMTNKNLFGSDIEKQLEMKVLAKTYRYDEDGGVE